MKGLSNMDIKKQFLSSVSKIIKEDKKNILYLLYYSTLEAILMLSIPLASSFIINSVLAHASISVFVLGSIVITMFVLITLIQIMKEYIVEKFQQKIFITTGIEIAEMATCLNQASSEAKHTIDKYMNYFFDVSAIQKLFPILLLDGTGLLIKIVTSLLLLLAFDPIFFGFGVFFFTLFGISLYFLGHQGMDYAVQRSDAKHSAIYYLQKIPNLEKSQEETLAEFDGYLAKYVTQRDKIFKVIIRQLTLTYIMEAVVISSFLIGGGYLVINGKLPIGEFVAAEIVVVSITFALKGFMKQIDYIYDMIEGFYKVNKLSISLNENADV